MQNQKYYTAFVLVLSLFFSRGYGMDTQDHSADPTPSPKTTTITVNFSSNSEVSLENLYNSPYMAEAHLLIASHAHTQKYPITTSTKFPLTVELPTSPLTSLSFITTFSGGTFSIGRAIIDNKEVLPPNPRIIANEFSR